MDKTTDVRRGASRFSRQIKQSGEKLFSGFDCAGGDLVSLEKSKKEKLRKLSLVGKASSSNEDCAMDCDVSEREDKLISQAHSMSNSASKKFKYHKKFLDDCNGVDHSCVPRKLRTAMKKRNSEYISPPLPDSKKVHRNHGGVESLKKDGIKRSKMNMKQGVSDWSREQTTASGPITKDEEEVAETLYALAGMFPSNDKTDNTKSDIEALEAKANPPAVPVPVEAPGPTSAVTKEDLDSPSPSGTAEVAPSSKVDLSPGGTTEVKSLNEHCVREQLDFLDNVMSHKEFDDSVPQVNPSSTMLSWAKSENCNEKTICHPFNFHGLPKPGLDICKVKWPTQHDTQLPETKPEILPPAAAVEGHLSQNLTEGPGKTGLALWPGLSSTMSLGATTHCSSRSSAAKIPAWLDAAISASKPSSSESGSSTGKMSKFTNNGKPMKRCAAHVYISRLIQRLKMPEIEDKLPPQPKQLSPHEVSKQGVLFAENNFSSSSLNGRIPGSSVGIPNVEATTSILQHKQHHQQLPRAVPASGLHISQKQSIDFLSLSSGGSGVEATNTYNKGCNRLEVMSQDPRVSLSQRHPMMPYTMPQARYTSSPYADQLPLAAIQQQVQLQLPQNLGSHFFYPSPMSSAANTRQQQQLRQPPSPQQQQQQQGLWAGQLAAQYRPTATSTAMTHFPSWPNGRQESMQMLCVQSIVPPQTPVSQQQQQLMAITSSLPPGRVKRQGHHLSSVYEDAGGAFRAGSALPMQLLCNERL